MKRIVLILSIISLSGCIAHRNAQQLARESLVHVSEYRAQLAKLAEIMEHHHRRTSETLERSLVENTTNMRSVNVDAAASRLADETLRAGFSASTYEAGLFAVIEGELEAIRTLEARIEHLEREYELNRGELVARDEQLRALEAKLLLLTKKRSAAKTVDDILPLLEEAEVAIESIQSELRADEDEEEEDDNNG